MLEGLGGSWDFNQKLLSHENRAVVIPLLMQVMKDEMKISWPTLLSRHGL